jgi:N-methylhydantoinase A/oxoprolinase/acetone carboxylase beta subunit/N-methylhydantoinase B/oxoprolinase/acetone carboxylase alpha subunit/acetone carboxylase gamma subunit
MYYIGVDIGGTFTDTVVVDDQGHLRSYKTESTPTNLAAGVMEALNYASEDLRLSRQDLLSATAYLAHGTTRATNAFIERKGALTGLITTKGFGDTMFIQRMMGFTADLNEEQIPHYSFRAYPVPIVPYNLVREVSERVDYKGEVIVKLNEDQVRSAVRNLVDAGVRAIAVCLLWSFRNPAHENTIKSIILEEAPGMFVSISSDLAPVIREYERCATTCINAYLAESVSSYVSNLDAQLRDSGLSGPFLLMNSIGGVLSAQEAPNRAVTLLASGPTGGVIGSLYLAALLKHLNVITTDMGGTSFDVGLIVDGRPVISTTSVVEKYHVLTPMINIHAIGAGGGSIARVEGGHLKVGPDSAGAYPGPVCYDKGGLEPTVTDADVVLGIIDPDYFLGGRLRLNKSKAETVIRDKIALPLNMTVAEAAAAIRTVVDSKMADLLRNLTLEKGYDPRDFVLYAYGGAGPMHCASYGSELDIKGIIVPATATVHSAYGAVASDIHYSHTLSDLMRTPPFFDRASNYLEASRIKANFEHLEQVCALSLAKNGVAEKDMVFFRYVDIQYRRQTHQITIPVVSGPITPASVDKMIEEFERKYEELYGAGAAYREAGIEITTFRVDAVGRMPKPALQQRKSERVDPLSTPTSEREVYFGEERKFVRTKVYRGLDINAGEAIEGPAILEYPGTTVLIGPGQRGTLDNWLNIMIEGKRRVLPQISAVPETESISPEIDPITFEVIRHRLQSITDEQAIALKSVSGSPIVTEATDFCCGLYLSDGSIVTMGRQVLFHAGTTSQVIKSVIRKCSEDPGIYEGDMFIVNNPYDGAVHPPDVSIVCPIFSGGKLVAWSGCAAHQLDVGGMVFGSWCSKATEIQQECMIIPPVKLIEKGKIRKDIWEMILAMSRLPFMIGLDFKAMIAANNVAKRRLTGMIENYGLGTVQAVMNGLIALSERRFRSRLLELPDGTFRGTDFLDHDGHANRVYKIELGITKSGDSLTYDFSKTSEQAPGFINCTKSGMIGGLFAGTLPMLAYDIPQNQGILNAIHIVAPEGIVNNAKWPAPVSSGTCATVWVTKNVTTTALARILGCSDRYHDEAQAVTDGSMAVLNLGGLNQYGEPFGTMLLDPIMGGAGAYPFKDGLDGSGVFEIPLPSIANVETNENFAPILYLYRRFIPDSGGPGNYRGGRSGGLAFTIHDTETLGAFLTTHGVEVPNSAGIFGGLPGSCNVNLHIKNAQLLEKFSKGELPSSSEEFEGEKIDLGAKPGQFTLKPGDIFEYTWQGGGGYGDPLNRDADLVRNDVCNSVISLECAKEIYGVVLRERPPEVDIEATKLLRQAIRKNRLELANHPPRTKTSKDGRRLLPMGEYLEVVAVDNHFAVRCKCGYDLGGADRNWKEQAATLRVGPESAGPRRKLHKDLEIVEFICPECGTILSVDIKKKDEPILLDTELSIDLLSRISQGK